MNNVFVLPDDDLGDVLYRRIALLIRKDWWGWRSLGAALGLGGGMLSVLLGALSWVVVRLFAQGGLGPLLDSVGLAFFVITLPLLALGAHCLDLLEQTPPVLPLKTAPKRRV